MITFDRTPVIKGESIKIYCFTGKVKDLKTYLRGEKEKAGKIN
ncbi:hypothetical protein CACET_c15420 [Clostridium aceticum]|uniref:Uncharacterized protein n=1 Tax=Clostridium aceticum TaxID=84022 RepID=A0A0G3W8M5_9CLOT|nr:hypothetical protein [Clostridium aceticum]AKL94991.1 hypothetical protein CACET_c15420 [Clostridium aceticum]